MRTAANPGISTRVSLCSTYKHLYVRGVKRYLRVLIPRSTNIGILLINGQFKIVNTLWESDSCQNSREPCSDAYDLDRPGMVDRNIF